MLPDWPDPSKSLNVSVYCLHNMDHYKTMYPGYTGIFVKSTVNRRICAVYLRIYKVHIVDHTLCRPSFAGNDHAARHLMQRSANADRGGPTGAGRHTRGCLRRATESRKTFLLSLELAGMGKGLDVTTTGRTGKNDGGAAEYSLTGNPGVDYLLKFSRAEVFAARGYVLSDAAARRSSCQARGDVSPRLFPNNRGGFGAALSDAAGEPLVHPGRPQCCFQTRARIRAGPPVPPRCAGAPTTTVAPLTGKASRLLRPSIP